MSEELKAAATQLVDEHFDVVDGDHVPKAGFNMDNFLANLNKLLVAAPQLAAQIAALVALFGKK